MFNNRYIIILLLVPLLCSCVSQKNYLIKDINFIEYESLTIDASRLIVVQKYNVNEVGLKLGYSTSSHFINAFKKKYGTTPKKYLGSVS